MWVIYRTFSKVGLSFFPRAMRSSKYTIPLLYLYLYAFWEEVMLRIMQSVLLSVLVSACILLKNIQWMCRKLLFDVHLVNCLKKKDFWNDLVRYTDVTCT